MVARNKPPRQRTAGHPPTASRPIDTIALFADKIRALHERDRALEAVVQLRDDGQIRKAKAELARAVRLSKITWTFEPSYNVAPTQSVPVVRYEDGESVGMMMRWGLIPFFAKGEPPKYSTINARIETVETAADGTALSSVVHITMPGNDLMRKIHNTGNHPHRMPAMLRREDHEAWLHGSLEEAQAVLQPYPRSYVRVRSEYARQLAQEQQPGPDSTRRPRSRRRSASLTAH